MSKILLAIIGWTSVIFLLSSCASTKSVTYFQDVPDTLRQKMVDLYAYYTPGIQPDDILQVSIQTLDPSATALLSQQSVPNLSTIGSNTSGIGNISVGQTSVSGYLVDKEGYVVLPLIGKISAKGKTTDQIRDEIRTKAAEYYKDPVVTVRFANFKVTVLGEVTRPSTYVMPNEKVTLLDAIGIAGDLTIYGRRENVLLIRDNNGKKEFARFDLSNSKIFASPYFYLRQGDVIYVEPTKAKVASTDMAQVRRLSVMATALSLLVIIATRVKF
jgi:polysaccharide export outer membrane protein